MQTREQLIIVAVSDTHNHEIDLPKGDIFIHCGDFTNYGTAAEIKKFCEYLKKIDFKHKIVVAGNHEIGLDQNYKSTNKNGDQNEYKQAKQMIKQSCIYLEHEMVEVEGIKIFGSPHTPMFHDWAFMYNKEEAKTIWQLQGPIDILITHGPPFGILDKVSKQCVGCPELNDVVFNLCPKYHLFGHIHPGYGHQILDNIHFYNCSIVNNHYKVVNKPHVITYQKN